MKGPFNCRPLSGQGSSLEEAPRYSNGTDTQCASPHRCNQHKRVAGPSFAQQKPPAPAGCSRTRPFWSRARAGLAQAVSISPGLLRPPLGFGSEPLSPKILSRLSIVAREYRYVEKNERDFTSLDSKDFSILAFFQTVSNKLDIIHHMAMRQARRKYTPFKLTSPHTMNAFSHCR